MGDLFPLTKAGKAACSVVAVAFKGSETLMARAIESVTGPVRRWGGVDLPTATVAKDVGALPGGPAVVLVTLDSLRKLAPDVETSDGAISRVAFIDDHGFACAAVGDKFFVVARTARGVFNGAVYLGDFRIDGPKEDLAVRGGGVVRTPQMAGRPAYLLTIWAHEPLYTAENWHTILDTFARDGVDRVYFWTSGHFPSKKFPQTYACKDGDWDSTVGTRIGTVEALRSVIRHGKEMGMKMYLGSGLGAWCGTGLITNKQPGTMKTGEGYASGSLCPSSQVARESLIEYFKEEFDALPEADGMFIEMADEWGACECPMCATPVDKFGSKQFGQSQLTLVQEIAREVWRDHPHARFAFTIGYDEHKSDPAFHEVVRQMSDPRFEWMEARNSWEFPGPGGKNMPASYFSRQVMSWSQLYAHPIEDLIERANRIAASGLYGCIMSFEPGFATGSFYKEIPFPTNILPYALTGFAYREVTWDPTLTVEGLRARIRDRFFGHEASEEPAGDLWALRELIRTSSNTFSISPDEERSLKQIEQRIKKSEPFVSPKTLEGLALMKRAIEDIRKYTKAG